MAKPARYDIDTYQNDTWPVGDGGETIFTVYDVATEGTRTAKDLTGATFFGDIKANTGPSETVIATFTFDLKNQITDTGQFSIRLTAAQTANLVTGTYRYDVGARFASGDVQTYVQGVVTSTTRVTDVP